MAQIVYKNINKRFGSVLALNDLNLTIADREFVTLVGPSGCGKSTTLNITAGLEDPSGGELYIDERLVNAVPPGERDIAMVF
ncbi:MAG: ABC transporter ATP-binding protein, partial [Caldilineaceae bacterium]|nr:ABC transporter ATP-binding protein [Caldilineaceae bacterium]